MKSLTLTQIREIQETIELITSAYTEGYISKEVADKACNMLQNRLQDNNETKNTCYHTYYYVLDISELHDLEQQYHVTNGTICHVLNIKKLYEYFQGEWMELG